MATTTNYGWTTPDDTALVKDGASAIRTLGSSVDTTTKNLNPETTLGDLAYRSSTANVKTRLGLGTANQVLAVNSGATAPEWKTLAASGASLISRTVITAAATTTVDSLFSDTYENYYLVLNYGMSSAGNNAILKFRYATTTHSANYGYGANDMGTNGSQNNDWYGANLSGISFPAVGATQVFSYSAFINRSSTASRALIAQHYHNDGLYNNVFRSGGFAINSAQAWGGVELTTNAGTLSGVLSVYGLAKS